MNTVYILMGVADYKGGELLPPNIDTCIYDVIPEECYYNLDETLEDKDELFNQFLYEVDSVFNRSYAGFDGSAYSIYKMDKKANTLTLLSIKEIKNLLTSDRGKASMFQPDDAPLTSTTKEEPKCYIKADSLSVTNKVAWYKEIGKGLTVSTLRANAYDYEEAKVICAASKRVAYPVEYIDNLNKEILEIHEIDESKALFSS